MDDESAFERQVANEVVGSVRQPASVDVTSIVSTATTQNSRWGFQSMFSATRIVAAGVIVAAFGGFVLADVLTQPNDEVVPAVASAPTTTANEILPGVDLETDEVSPGIFRILGDGTNDLSQDTWHVAVSGEGSVYVEQHEMQSFASTTDDEDLRSVGSRVFRLGQDEAVVLSGDANSESGDQEVVLSTTEDGLVYTGDPDTSQGAVWSSVDYCHGVFSFGGFAGPDGSCWFVPVSSEVFRRLPGKDLDPDGRIRTYELAEPVVDPSADVGQLPRWELQGDDRNRTYDLEELGMDRSAASLSGWEGWPLMQLAMSGDGTIWAAGDMPGTTGAQFSSFDGESWTRVPAMEPVDDLNESLDDVHLDIAGGPGATLWASHWDRRASVLHAWHWDGAHWTAYGPIQTPMAPALPLDTWPIPWSGIHVSKAGIVWLDGLVRFDGDRFEVFDVPASANVAEPRIGSLSHGPDGSLWLTVVGDAPPGDAICTREPDRWCADASDGLYVITPVAVTAVE